MSHPDYFNHPGHADHDPALDDNFKHRTERTLVLNGNPYDRRETSTTRDTPADLKSVFRRAANLLLQKCSDNLRKKTCIVISTGYSRASSVIS